MDVELLDHDEKVKGIDMNRVSWGSSLREVWEEGGEMREKDVKESEVCVVLRVVRVKGQSQATLCRTKDRKLTFRRRGRFE